MIEHKHSLDSHHTLSSQAQLQFQSVKQLSAGTRTRRGILAIYHSLMYNIKNSTLAEPIQGFAHRNASH